MTGREAAGRMKDDKDEGDEVKLLIEARERRAPVADDGVLPLKLKQLYEIKRNSVSGLDLSKGKLAKR